MKNRLHTIIISLLVLFSCKTVEDAPAPDGAAFSKNFVQVYVLNPSLALNFEQSILTIHFEGQQISNRKREDAAIYTNWSEFYGDGSYNKKLIPYSNYALAHEIYEVDLVCDQDYDATHPPGSSLGDIVKIYAVSCFDFISGGYRSRQRLLPPELNGVNLERPGYQSVFKYLKDIQPGDLKLIDKTGYLYLEKLPESPGIYEFTLTVRQDRTIRETIKIQF